MQMTFLTKIKFKNSTSLFFKNYLNINLIYWHIFPEILNILMCHVKIFKKILALAAEK